MLIRESGAGESKNGVAPSGFRRVSCVIATCAATVLVFASTTTLAKNDVPDSAQTAQSAQSPDPNVAPLVVPLAPVGTDDWQPLTFRSIEQTTRYDIAQDPEGRAAYRATSECSASGMLLALPENFDLARTPRLAWRWRVEAGLDNAAERTIEGDDFAARVYVLYRFDESRASVWRRLQDQLGRRLFGVEMPGQALSYVWASRAEVRSHWPNPSQSDVRNVAVESGSDRPEANVWREQIVDLAADAARVFDRPPRRPPYALGLMTDSDDTCDRAIAGYSDFRLLGPAGDRGAKRHTPVE